MLGLRQHLDALREQDPHDPFGLRTVVRFTRDPLELLISLSQTRGDWVELDILGTPWVLLSHPADIEAAFVEHARIMGRDAYVATLERTLGKGLLTSDGPLWRRQRKLMAQAFTPRRIRGYAQTMAEVGARGLSWREGQAINLHREMSRLTMEIVAAVLFGASIGPREVELVAESMEAINAYYAASPEALTKLPSWVPTPLNRRVTKAVEQLDALIFEIIADRRRGRTRGDDLLGTLVAAVDEGGEGMSDQQLRDEAMTLFLAGHETTALTL
ncbi:MAG: cytochrome P450, partial [Myxococcales bacterium]|nr:cytochrome P450 [Myxococcales bacterium]